MIGKIVLGHIADTADRDRIRREGPGEIVNIPAPGLTKREEFAKAALPVAWAAYCSGGADLAPDECAAAPRAIAESAFAIADAMLEVGNR